MNSLPYLSVSWVSVIINTTTIRIVTKKRVDVMQWIIYLPKELVAFMLQHDIHSPQPFTLLDNKEEVGWLIDAICFSPDEQTGFLTVKNLYYITTW